jgi:hypothetical protein
MEANVTGRKRRKWGLRITPTNIEDWSISRVDDIQSKEGIPIEVRIRNRRLLSVT